MVVLLQENVVLEVDREVARPLPVIEILVEVVHVYESIHTLDADLVAEAVLARRESPDERAVVLRRLVVGLVTSPEAARKFFLEITAAAARSIRRIVFVELFALEGCGDR